MSLQHGRCIYCHRSFGPKLKPTKDHILPIIRGGADWALNILLACRQCNSRRNDIPFRTYCKLLRKSQNELILKNLARRILTIRPETPVAAIDSFFCGLLLHEPKHPRYQMIFQGDRRSQQNALSQTILPSAPSVILKRARL
uniref:HNH endonuclease 5 domain-containing protein n=1 Tax=Acidobacterium capsulatum TaxID=33075 RepID=A0A7V4XU38_9BACT